MPFLAIPPYNFNCQLVSGVTVILKKTYLSKEILNTRQCLHIFVKSCLL